jgi:hypothetical protein
MIFFGEDQVFLLQFQRMGDPGGYWWPPTYSNWFLVPVFYSTRLSVLLYNCEFYTFGVV